jgi:hypothetical protein
MSPRKAIGKFCKSCIYDQHQSGTWRLQVQMCNVTTCPLFEFRPSPIVKKNTVNHADLVH